MRNNEERIGANTKIQDTTPVQQLIQGSQENNSLDLNFIVPTEVVDLPSKGKFYSVGHPLHGKNTIEIKQMTAKEEDILTSKSLLKKGIALDKLIQSLIVDKNINPDLLTIEDRSAIVVAARIFAYGPDYTTNITCPSCLEKTKYSFNLLEKISKEHEEEHEEPEFNESGNFYINLPVAKWKVECRVLNGVDEKTLGRIAELKKKSINDSTLIDQLKLIIVSIQGVSDKTLIEKAINALPAADSKYIRKQYEKNVQGVDLKQNFICPKCSDETELEVPLTADFFWFK
jgi:hypothetical protein